MKCFLENVKIYAQGKVYEWIYNWNQSLLRKEYDLKVKLTEIIFTNTPIKTGLVKGVQNKYFVVEGLKDELGM
jgi:hypothetical protein